MRNLCWIILLTGLFPLWRAWQANRRTSLLQAVNWALLAWISWSMALAAGGEPLTRTYEAASYFALCLTGCAGMAVLGARRPGVTAWNFVVLALLAVNLLPLAESVLRGGSLELSPFRATCVAGTIAVGILNYLPTRLWLAVASLMLGCGLEFVALVRPSASETDRLRIIQAGWWALALVPWLGWVAGQGLPMPASAFDQRWLEFRNRFGFVWAQRVRDQFQRSAAHAGWPVVLRWQGLRLRPGAALPSAEVQEAMLATMEALLKRFGPETPQPPSNLEDGTEPK